MYAVSELGVGSDDIRDVQERRPSTQGSLDHQAFDKYAMERVGKQGSLDAY